MKIFRSQDRVRPRVGGVELLSRRVQDRTEVVVIDVASGQVESRIPVGRVPHGAAVR